MNKQKEKNEYIKTVMWSVFAAVIMVCVMVSDVAKNSQNISKKSFLNVEYKNKHARIDQLVQMEKADSDNYLLNLEMAILHESLKEYNQARINYEKAVLKSPNVSYVLYRAAKFYVILKDYERAIELSLLLPNWNEKKLIAMKTDFYGTLANSFLEDKDYANAIKTNKIAYKFAKNAGPETKDKIAFQYSQSYVKYADKCIQTGEANLAINALNNALEVYKDPLALYKLGLIYKDIDNKKAQKYIEEAYKLSPNIINLDMYNDLLNTLIKEADANSDFSASRFYQLKQAHLKRKLVVEHFFSNDFVISDVEVIKKRIFIFWNSGYYLKFNIKNNSKDRVDNLYLRVMLQTQKDVIQEDIRLVNKSEPFEAGSVINNVEIKIPLPSNFDNDFKFADVQFYARKTKKHPWVLIDNKDLN